jgi:hypothetical protein
VGVKCEERLDLGAAAAKFDAGLAGFAALQWLRRARHAPSPCSLSADSDWPRQRRKRRSSSQARGRSASLAIGAGAREEEAIERGAESVCGTTLTYPSFGRLYTPSLDSSTSDPKAEADPDELCLKDARSGSDSAHQRETPESSVHWVPMPWTKTTNNSNSSVALKLDSLASSWASSVVKGSGIRSEESLGKATYSDVVSSHLVLQFCPIPDIIFFI